METKQWYETFMDTLHKKFSKKTQLTQSLMDVLSLEREAVYRRLRNEVPFSSDEIIKIVSAWNISLDEITGCHSDQYSFQMKIVNYLDPSLEEQMFLRKVIDSIRFFQNSPDAELMDICNKVPHSLLAGFENLNHYYMFKWKYLYGNPNDVAPFSQVVMSDAEKQLMADYYSALKLIPNTSFIWDNKIFEYLITDIQFFHSICLITDEEKELIKKDLYRLLDYMQEVASKGCYPETGNKVNLYISQLNLETNYTYTLAPEANICFIIVFEIYEIFSFNTEIVSNFMTWMQLKKRTATQISEVDEMNRIKFFNKQRQFINSL